MSIMMLILFGIVVIPLVLAALGGLVFLVIWSVRTRSNNRRQSS